MVNKCIPTVKFPSIGDYNINCKDEPIVSISKEGILCQSKYYERGISGSYLDCYARKKVVELLKEAEKLLPDGYRLKVYDAYRPICIQRRLWDFYRNKLKYENKGLSEDELDFKTSFFVSKPSYDISKPSLHNTGGAVDLTIVRPDGKELNMGTEFDDFSDKAWTNHFEIYSDNEEVRDNRRLLYNVMLSVGFTNLPSEWWHYDYGTKFWGYFNNTDALYEGVLDIEFPNRFPLI